jgi:hypothetical protein
LTAQGHVVDLHATDRVIISFVFGILGFVTVAITVAIAFLIIVVFYAVFGSVCTARVIAI